MNFKNEAKLLLIQMLKGRTADLVEYQTKTLDRRLLVLHPWELGQIDQMANVLEQAWNAGREAGIHAAISPVLREADARLKPTETKKVLEKLCSEIRELKVMKKP